jgi:hypothetical protein
MTRRVSLSFGDQSRLAAAVCLGRHGTCSTVKPYQKLNRPKLTTSRHARAGAVHAGRDSGRGVFVVRKGLRPAIAIRPLQSPQLNVGAIQFEQFNCDIQLGAL